MPLCCNINRPKMDLTGNEALKIYTSSRVTDTSTSIDHSLSNTQTTQAVSILSEPGMVYQPQGPRVVHVQRSDTSVMPPSTYIYLSNKDKFESTPKIDAIPPGTGNTLSDLMMADGQETLSNYSNNVNRPTPVMLFLNQDQNTNTSMETNLVLHHPLISDMYHIQNNLSSIYAIAQANLVAQTQQDIAKQLIGQNEGHNQVNVGQIENLPQQPSTTHTSVQGNNNAPNNKVLIHTSQKEKEGKCPGDKEDKEEKMFVCKLEKCGRNFSSVGHLRNHQTNHSRDNSLTCTHEGCGRTFTWPAHLKYHKLTHMSARNFSCNMCDKKFYTAQRLKVHTRVHTGEKPFPCDECDKEFSTSGNLKNHKRIHSGERPYVCSHEKCEKRFAEYSSLRKHVLTHTGEKPFKCEKCGRCFTQSGSLTVHMKKHLLAEEEEDRVKNVIVVHNGQDDLLQYQELQLVFSQGVSDHIVTVTTQTADHDEKFPPIANEMLLSEDVFQSGDAAANVGTMTDENMMAHGSANVVVVAQPQMMVSMTTDFHDPHGREEIVYDSEFLHSDLVNEGISHNITETTSSGKMEISTQVTPSSISSTAVDQHVT
ncbi:zinc finger protein 76-like [Ylistrum balloti]|uniref:zinc finger protein 76-like n=1 Tax=Ylistrum balloti TaxID=509963 RepID=UPI0029059C1D|nr:zinc finger protein 76-like [Ylistrum balloti]